jgi:hypothetical protein
MFPMCLVQTSLDMIIMIIIFGEDTNYDGPRYALLSILLLLSLSLSWV